MTQVNTSTIASLFRKQRGWIGIAASVAAAVLATPARAADPSAAWQPDVYYTQGSIVSYQGRLYQALLSQIDFRGTGHNPTLSSLWKDLGSSSGDRRLSLRSTWFTRKADTAESGCALTWDAGNTYTTGGVASVNGINYRANWWTRGESPSTHSAGISDPWTMIGSCSASSKTADSEPAPADTSGSNSRGAVQAHTGTPSG